MKTFNDFVKESLELFDNKTKGIFRNPNLSGEELETYAVHEDPHIRQAVASHSNVNSELLHHLSQDPNHDVKLAVAVNKNTSENTLNGLSNSPSMYIKNAIANHPNASKYLLRKLALDRKQSPVVLSSILKHKNCDDVTRNLIVAHPNKDNRLKVDHGVDYS